MTDSLVDRLKALRWEPSSAATSEFFRELQRERRPYDDVSNGTWDEAMLALYQVDADRLKAAVLRVVADRATAEIVQRPDDPVANIYDGALLGFTKQLHAAADALAPAPEERT